MVLLFATIALVIVLVFEFSPKTKPLTPDEVDKYRIVTPSGM
jgi:hypothetical protein